MKKKHIITIVLLIVLLLAGIKGVLVYHDYRSEKERMAQKPYFTKDKLNEAEMNILEGQFHVEVTPSWRKRLNKEDWPNYSYYIIKATEDTEVVLIVLLLAAVKGVLVYQDYRSEEERMAQSPYFTKYKLSRLEMQILDGRFYVEITPRWRERLKEEDWPDYSYYTIESTEDTEMVVTVMNYWLFDDLSKYDKGGWEKAKEYGVTTDNRLTVEWVMEHPKEAVEIQQSMASEGDIFGYREDIVSIYESITSNSTEE